MRDLDEDKKNITDEEYKERKAKIEGAAKADEELRQTMLNSIKQMKINAKEDVSVSWKSWMLMGSFFILTCQQRI